MMKILFSFFSFLFFLASCQEDLPTTMTENPDLETGAYRYLALGDSYTIGESVEDFERWPNQLADSLKNLDLDLAVVDNIAVTGWTTGKLLDGIEAADLDPSYDFVSLLIGVNNFYQGRSIEEYETEFDTLLDQALGFVGGDISRMIVLSIPDYAYTPFGQSRPDPAAISAGIDAFNAVNKALTEARGIQYFDITPISRLGLSQPELVAADGLHPSSKQYAAWVSQIVETARMLFP